MILFLKHYPFPTWLLKRVQVAACVDFAFAVCSWSVVWSLSKLCARCAGVYLVVVVTTAFLQQRLCSCFLLWWVWCWVTGGTQ